MCQYSTIELVSTECGQTKFGQPVHQYTKYVYWLCRDARHDKPCDNKFLKDGHVWSDVGSRQGRCPVCDATAIAEARYKIAYERAMAEFDRATRRAYDQKLVDLDEAKYVVETYPHKERHPRRYRHSWN